MTARARAIRRQIEQTTSDYDRDKLEERLAKLTGSVAILEVGAHTEAAMKEKKMQVEDAVNAVNATRAASREGVVVGGGLALLRASRVLETLEVAGDERAGVAIVRRACAAPLRQIAAKVGQDGAFIVQEALERGDHEVFDAMTSRWLDMTEAGIVDPVLVVRTALENAASIGAMVLTSDLLVTHR